MLTREQKGKEVPPLGESVKRIANSIVGLADTAVKSTVMVKRMREEAIKQERIIAKQQAEIVRLTKLLEANGIDHRPYKFNWDKPLTTIQGESNNA